MKSFQFIIFLSFIVFAYVNCEIYTCGGFVKAANGSVDYSKIQVKLLTIEGNLKFEAECNSINGYYMIPVYNKGEYIIRLFAPTGFHFEPNSVTIKVDGLTDQCSRNEDINFELTAFSVEGVVVTSNGRGPSGVSLTLTANDGKIIAETKTSTNGAYEFRVSPGKYLVSTAEDSSECIELGMVNIEVISSPVKVKPDLKISGQLLTVEVYNGNQPLMDALVEVSSKLPIKTAYCEIRNKVRKDEKICSIRTNKLGVARFPCLPPGEYLVRAAMESQKLDFLFSPKFDKISIDLVANKVVFKTIGFNVQGQVLIGGKFIADAQIVVDNNIMAKSDIEGKFELKELGIKEITISAIKEHYEFEKYKIDLSRDVPHIPSILAINVDICYSVDAEGCDQITFNVQNQRNGQSFLNDYKCGEGVKCISLEPGVYILSVVGINCTITPNEIMIDATKGPVLNVHFSQFKANVIVETECINCDGANVELWKEGNLIKSHKASKKFMFTDVLPSAYKMKINDNQQFCWKNKETDLIVENADAFIKFIQTGFAAFINCSHGTHLEWQIARISNSEKRKEKDDDEKSSRLSGEIDLPSGQSHICLPAVGVYKFTPDSCLIFNEPKIQIEIPQKSVLIMSAIKFKIIGSITTSDHSASSKDFSLIVKIVTGERIIEVVESKRGTFDFSFFLSEIDSGLVNIVPKSSIYLFKPDIQSFEFRENCIVLPSFLAEKGKFFEGKIIPPLEDVNILLVHKLDHNNAWSSKTDVKGEFRLGPFREVDDFDVIAEKEGYKLEKTDVHGVLIARKLSQLKITIIDSESNSSLGSVLLSLSGVNNYRSNNLIDQSGSITFIGLPSGEYFIRPILQEYQFEPPTVVVNMNEDEVENILLKGKKFAYSVFGEVTHLAGQPVPSLVVEAVSEQCSYLQEEDTTSEKGEYRIRGLRPSCLYRIIIKSKEGQRLRSYPIHYDVSVINKDINDIDFTLTHFERPIDIAGNVNFIGVKSPSEYKIALYRGETAIHYVTVNAPSLVFFFEIAAPDNLEYVVRFETAQGHADEKYDSQEVSFIANQSFIPVNLTVKSQRKPSEVEISKGSYLALPFFFFIAYIFMNQHKVMPALEAAIMRVSKFSVQRSVTPSDEHSDSLRRRVKTKRT